MAGETKQLFFSLRCLGIQTKLRPLLTPTTDRQPIANTSRNKLEGSRTAAAVFILNRGPLPRPQGAHLIAQDFDADVLARISRLRNRSSIVQFVRSRDGRFREFDQPVDVGDQPLNMRIRPADFHFGLAVPFAQPEVKRQVVLIVNFACRPVDMPG